MASTAPSPTPAAAPTAGDEWRAHWTLVLAAAIGISQISLAVYTLGLFMEPLTSEFRWSRTEVSSAVTILSLAAIPLGPLMGTILDRFGPRRLALPGVVLQGVTFSALALLTGSIVQWWGIWLVYAVVLQLVSIPVWSAAVTSVFNVSRGLALAVMMCGTSLGTAIAPPLTHYLIAEHGWRMAYVALGLGWAAVILLVAVPFFFGGNDRRQVPGAQSPGQATAALPGLTVREAFRDSSLIRIAVVLGLLSGLFAALIVHLVPILTAGGMSRATAAGLLPLIAVSGLISKLATGWLLDHVRVGVVAGLSFGLGLIPFLCLLLGGRSLPLVVFMILVAGWAMAAYLQASTYLISRYAGPRNFGLIFGVLISVMAVSSGVLPMLAGYVYDLEGNYTLLFTFGIGATAISGLLMATLGAYPDWTRQDRQEVFS